MEKWIIIAVRKDIATCTGKCENNCPCQKLLKFIDEIGFDEFSRRFEKNTLPKDLKEIFLVKAKKYSS